METKIGIINKNKIEDIEKKIFDFKASLFNYEFTFNEESFNLDFLLKLHEFFFGDLYEYAGKISLRYENEDKSFFENIIYNIMKLIIEKTDADIIINKINDFIDLQMFEDGNTRTIKIFFKNAIYSFYMYDEDYKNEFSDYFDNNIKSL